MSTNAYSSARFSASKSKPGFDMRGHELEHVANPESTSRQPARYVWAVAPKGTEGVSGMYVRIDSDPYYSTGSQARDYQSLGWKVDTSQKPVGLVVDPDFSGFQYVPIEDAESGKYSDYLVAGLYDGQIPGTPGWQIANLNEIGTRVAHDPVLRKQINDMNENSNVHVSLQNIPTEKTSTAAADTYQRMADQVRAEDVPDDAHFEAARQQEEADRARHGADLSRLSEQTIGQQTQAQMLANSRSQDEQAEAVSMANDHFNYGVQALLKAGRADLIKGMKDAGTERSAQFGALAGSLASLRQGDIGAQNVALQRQQILNQAVANRESIAQMYEGLARDVRSAALQSDAAKYQTASAEANSALSRTPYDPTQLEQSIVAGVANSGADLADTWSRIGTNTVQKYDPDSALKEYTDALSKQSGPGGSDATYGTNGNW